MYRYLKNVFKIEGELEPEDDIEFEDDAGLKMRMIQRTVKGQDKGERHKTVVLCLSPCAFSVNSYFSAIEVLLSGSRQKKEKAVVSVLKVKIVIYG